MSESQQISDVDQKLAREAEQHSYVMEAVNDQARKLEKLDDKIDRKLDALSDKLDRKLDAVTSDLTAVRETVSRIDATREHIATKAWILSGVIGGIIVAVTLAVTLARYLPPSP